MKSIRTTSPRLVPQAKGHELMDEIAGKKLPAERYAVQRRATLVMASRVRRFLTLTS